MKRTKKRNPVAVAMNKRYGSTTTTMKDRREERGGQKNEQVELLEQAAEFEYDDNEETDCF